MREISKKCSNLRPLDAKSMQNSEKKSVLSSVSKRTYNSGKISGLTHYDALVKFETADKEISSYGLTPVNPLKSWIPHRAPWLVHIIADVLILATCRKIYLQTDWEDSKGARIEKKAADLLRIKKIYQSEKVDAKKVDEAHDKRNEFARLFLTGVKIRFNRGDKRIARFMEVARSCGVDWKAGCKDPKEDSFYFPDNGLLYIWQSGNGTLHFAHGGSRSYFDESSEREIFPDTFFEVWDRLNEIPADNG